MRHQSAVLLASIEEEGDSRPMQADTVLRIAKKKLWKVRARIDRQEAEHRNLFLAYFDRKERSAIHFVSAQPPALGWKAEG